MVAVDATDDVEVRRNCLWAEDEDDGEDALRDGPAVRMLVGEHARRLVGDEDAVDICPEAASGNIVARGAKGVGFPASAPCP